MKKSVKFIIALLTLILVVGMTFSPVLAAGGDALNPTSINPSYTDMGSITSKAALVMGFIRNIAVIGGVIILMIIGVKYMMGSVEEKADYKKSLIPLVIGILVVMMASQIMLMLVNFFGA